MTGVIDALYRRILLAAHPVGSVYITFDADSPAELFGGTWEEIEQGRTLIQSGTAYPAGSTGGEATHTLTINEMPSHEHRTVFYGSGGRCLTLNGGGSEYQLSWNTSGEGGSDLHVGKTGGGQSHNNMPPYIAVHIWRRTS